MRGLVQFPLVRCLPALGAALLSVGTWTGPPALAIAAAPHPLAVDFEQVGTALTPPTEAQCNARGRRCFAPAAFQNAYNLSALYAAGNQGQGVTVAVVDSFGSNTIRADLNNFNTQFGLPHMCGEDNHTCAAGDPKFDILCVQACTDTKAPPPTADNPGLESRNAWIVEVSLDVEWVHAVAPRANVLLVTTPTAETLGVQGFPQMMNAEQVVIDQGLAQVISQSFGASEETFNGGTAALENLRGAFKSAPSHNVSVLASTGDFGNGNIAKTPVPVMPLIPFPNVGWPASDPLVTAVGGTYLCMDAATGTHPDSSAPSGQCPLHPGAREVGWIASGGGFSHVFSKPAYQDTLPPGSNTAANTNNMRGIPDVAMEASSRTGVLVYGNGSWFIVGGTSVSSPCFAGVVAIADQVNGAPLGYLNNALYKIGADPARYAHDFYDITTGNNDQYQTPQDPNYAATTGWDPVTGLGTPNAANLVPDLIAAVHGK